MMTDQVAYSEARRRAKAKYGFFVHAVVYAAVMALLVVINVFTAPGYAWVEWPMLGWGGAVVLHGIRVYVLPDKRSEIVDALTERELRLLNTDKTSGEGSRKAAE